MSRVVVLCVLILPGLAFADPYGVGDRLQGFELSDQHGATHRVDESVRAVLFAVDMDGGGIIRDLLEEEEGRILAETGSVYVADVSGMPALVRQILAIPRMRRRPYPMLLDEEGSITARLPGKAGLAAVLVLDALELVRIEEVATKEALREALSRLRAAPDSEATEEPEAEGTPATEDAAS